MKDPVKLVLVPTLICLVCTAILAGVSALTQGPIDAAKAMKEKAAVLGVLPDGMTNFTPLATGTATNFVVLDGADRLVAAAVKGHSRNGYGGDITLMVGFNANGDIHDFEVLEASETPGLGSRIASPQFKAKIRGRPASTQWFVKKDAGDIDAITAATISSRAALEAVRDAVKQFETLRATIRNGAPATP